MEMIEYSLQHRDCSRSALSVVDYSITVLKVIRLGRFKISIRRTYFANNMERRWKNSLGFFVNKVLSRKLDDVFPINFDNEI